MKTRVSLKYFVRGCSGYQFLLFFQIFFKVQATLPYSESVFFNVFYPTNANEFSAYGNSTFLFGAILLLLEIISVIKR